MHVGYRKTSHRKTSHGRQPSRTDSFLEEETMSEPVGKEQIQGGGVLAEARASHTRNQRVDEN